MSFLMALVAFSASPLYFLFQGRILAALFNGALYFAAIVGLFVFVIPGIFIWAVCAGHAFWDMRAQLREKEMQRQAVLIGEQARAAAPRARIS